MKINPRFTWPASVLILSLVGTLPGVAQEAEQPAPPPAQTAPSGGWRKFQPPAGDQQNAQQNGQQQPAPDQGAPFPAGDPQDQQQGQPPQGPAPQGPPPPRYAPTTISLP